MILNQDFDSIFLFKSPLHLSCLVLCARFCRDLGQGAYALSFVAAAAGSWSLDVSACGQTLSAIQFTVPVPIGTRGPPSHHESTLILSVLFIDSRVCQDDFRPVKTLY